MLCAMCRSHESEADTIFALKQFSLFGDRVGINRSLEKFFGNITRRDMGSVYRSHHGFSKGIGLDLEVSYSIHQFGGERSGIKCIWNNSHVIVADVKFQVARIRKMKWQDRPGFTLWRILDRCSSTMWTAMHVCLREMWKTTYLNI